MISVFASTLRFTFRTVMLAGFLALFLFPMLMVINRYRDSGTPAGARKADAAGIRVATMLLWLFGVRVEARGKPADAPVLIAANHISWMDILALHTVVAMGFVAKAEIAEWPVFNYVATTGGSIFHQRGSHDSASGVADLMVQRLRQGRCVAIFPEGGILPGNSVRVFHARMFRAAVDAGCPVQPVMVRYLTNGQRDDDISFRDGESMLGNFGRMLARPRAVADVHFLPVIDTAGKQRRALANAAREAVVASYDG